MNPEPIRRISAHGDVELSMDLEGDVLE